MNRKISLFIITVFFFFLASSLIILSTFPLNQSPLAKNPSLTPTPKPVSLSCSFPDTNKKTTIKVYIWNNLMRISGLTINDKNKGKGNVLLKGNNAWIWEEGIQKGLSFSFKRRSQIGSSFLVIDDSPSGMINSILDIIEGEKKLCSSGSNFSLSLFEVPKSILFITIPSPTPTLSGVKKNK